MVLYRSQWRASHSFILVPGLTVVTHTYNRSSKQLERCVDSVENALPKNANHVVIDVPHDDRAFQQARIDAMKLNDMVAFVDDDDYIHPDSLRLCTDALLDTECGIAFTREIIQRDGAKGRSRIKEFKYDLLSSSVRYVHHLTMYNTKHISSLATELNTRFNLYIGIEWVLKYDAAHRAGAIHVPIDGYYWIEHKHQCHRNSGLQQEYANNLSSIKKTLQEYDSTMNFHGTIPVWTNGCPN